MSGLVARLRHACGPRGARRRDDAGAVAIVVVACMMLFFGLLAFAIDMGETRVQRSRAQGVADNAALKAAYAYCRAKGASPTAGDPAWRTTAVDAGRAVAASNGLPGATVAPEGAGWRATVGINVAAKFSGVLDVHELGTGATSLAESDCSSRLPYSILALSTTCPDTVRLNGGGNQIDGAVHSNNAMKWTGGSNIATGGVTSVSAPDIGDTSGINPPPVGGATVVQDPLGPDGASERIELWRPGSARALALGTRYFNLGGTEVNDAIIAARGAGVYYTTNRVNLSNGFTGPAGGITFIVDSASSTNGFSTANYTLTHYRDTENNPNDLLLFTTKPSACGSGGVTLGGGGGTFTGVIYAPNGRVTFNGSNNVGTNGSVIAQVVTFNGNGQTLRNNGNLSTSTPGLSLAR